MILVANTKGGCGKSTTSMQLLAPWILSRIGQAKVVEIDDENHDSASYTKSRIQSEQVTIGQEGHVNFAVNRLIDKTDDHYIVGDIGGNRTCSMILKALGESSYDTFVDLIAIPITSTGQDVVNARKTLKMIKESMPGFSGKIVLVITRADTTDVAMLEEIMPDAFVMLEKHSLEGPVILPSDQCYPQSRFLERTVYELSEVADTLKAEIEQTMTKVRRNREERRHYSQLSGAITRAAQARPHLEKQFKALDAIMDLKTAAADFVADKKPKEQPAKNAKAEKASASA